MYMYIYIYVCICIYMHVYVYICTCKVKKNFLVLMRCLTDHSERQQRAKLAQFASTKTLTKSKNA